jgi:hypothetical protein
MVINHFVVDQFDSNHDVKSIGTDFATHPTDLKPICFDWLLTASFQQRSKLSITQQRSNAATHQQTASFQQRSKISFQSGTFLPPIP